MAKLWVMAVYDPLAVERLTRYKDIARFITSDAQTLLLRPRDGTRVWIAGGTGPSTSSLRMMQAQRGGTAEIPICFRLDFDRREQHIWQPLWMVSLEEERLRFVGSVPTEFEADEDWLDHRPTLPHEQPLFFEHSWQTAVRHIQNEIARGTLRKAVLTRQIEMWHTHAWPAHEVAAALLHASAGTSVFAHHWHGGVVWIGASPEILYQREGRQVVVDSLAGTRRMLMEGDSFTAKDHVEQQLVTDYLVEVLTPLCEHVNVSPVSRRRADDLEHVYTQVTGVLRHGVGDDELLGVLHPTPAVCGAPRARAMELIQALEPQPRELYSGVLGYSTGHATTALVVLRCAKLQDSTARLYGGAGIVAGSDPELEFAECGWKMDIMRRALLELT
ncbi:MAG: chorismate-binding protein [bacterium]|nr:chorismate-binding protein [bacterium]MBK8127828.1 chorismate-binding protein [bacterium]